MEARLSAFVAVRRALGACTLLGTFSAFAAVACHHHVDVMSAAALASIHARCADDLSNGTLKLHANSAVGLGPRTPRGTPVVIYGASWCVACKDAAAYLALEHIPFVEHDIEADAAAQAASDRALRSAGLAPTNSLPVIDVRGTVTIGFVPCAIDAAWSAD